MEKTIGKYKIKVIQDMNADSPDIWRDEERFLVYDHRQFSVQRKGFNAREIFEATKKKKTFNGYWVFPVYAYIHGGVALSVGSHNFPDARWDVSMSGFALIKRESGTYTEKTAFKAAEGLIEEWNQYLSGDVYGYKIVDENDDEIESNWGYYGSECCMTEAESIVEFLINENNLTIEV